MHPRSIADELKTSNSYFFLNYKQHIYPCYLGKDTESTNGSY